MRTSWLLCLIFPCVTHAQLTVAKIFSSDMLLQREKPIAIWGKAAPKKIVTVSFSAATKTTIVRNDSTWQLYLKPQKATATPQQLSISCNGEKIVFTNILIGDVWLGSGQSNMEWPVVREVHWKEEKQHTLQPLIRFNNPPPAGRNVYGVSYTDSLNKRLNNEDFYQWTSWQSCDSNTVKSMSAVGYYFAKSIVQETGVPIGLINLSIGGAPLETFVSREALAADSRFARKVIGDWLVNDHLPEWIRERGKQNVGNNATGYRDDLGLNHAYKLGFAYECGVKPLLPFPIKGVLWYQGESNSLEKARVEEYKDLLHLLISDYRKGWKQPDMPFYWVQLSSIDTSHYKSQFWPQFRDEQRKLLDDVKSGGMAVSSDWGLQRDVHPTNKKVVGERLARWALCQEYGKPVTPSGPLPLQANYKRGKVVISFRYAKGLKTSNGNALRGFSLDGNTDTDAAIQADNVVITATQKPAFIYYGWKPFSDGNLLNEDNLPASTFKLEVK